MVVKIHSLTLGHDSLAFSSTLVCWVRIFFHLVSASVCELETILSSSLYNINKPPSCSDGSGLGFLKLGLGQAGNLRARVGPSFLEILKSRARVGSGLGICPSSRAEPNTKPKKAARAWPRAWEFSSSGRVGLFENFKSSSSGRVGPGNLAFEPRASSRA